MAGETGKEQPVEVVIDPHSERYDPDDERWLEQVTQLYRSLHDDVGGVRKESEPVEGAKGDVSTIIMALGSAGAFTAAVQLFQSWLARDRTRSITITRRNADGTNESITVQGTVDRATFERVAAGATSGGER